MSSKYKAANIAPYRSLHAWLWLVVVLVLPLCGCTAAPRASLSSATMAQEGAFALDPTSKHNRSGIWLETGAAYWFEITVTETLHDGRVICTPPFYLDDGANCRQPIGPEGFLADGLPWLPRLAMWMAAPFRPMNEKNSRWLEAVGRIDAEDGAYFSLAKHCSKQFPYRATVSGELVALVNDFPWLGRYANNRGRLRVEVHRLKAHEAAAL